MQNSFGLNGPPTAGPAAQPTKQDGSVRLTPDHVSGLRGRRRYMTRRRWEWVFLSLAAAAVILFGLSFKPVRVVGHSMEPTFHDGETVLAWRLASRLNGYKPGDVIVFRAEDGAELIKRVVFVQNPWGMARMPETLWTPSGPMSVPQVMAGTGKAEFPGYEEDIANARNGAAIRKTLYVMGDNTWGSDDSRRFGPIDPDTVLGKVVAIVDGHSLIAYQNPIPQ